MVSNKGFTLVELSIVLVIIGLLIGGILVAQSMIGTAKIQAFVKQIQQYDIMQNNFIERYKCLPGDSDKFGGSGNCDGMINDLTNNNSYWTGEIREFWQQVYAVKMLSNTSVTGVLPGGDIKLGATFPEAAVGVNCGVVPNYPDPTEHLANIIRTNTYTVHEVVLQTPGQTSTVARPCMSTMEALAIDTKMDDASADTGNIVAGGTQSDLSTYYRTDSFDTYNCFEDTGTNFHPKFDLANKQPAACGLHIKNLISSGG